MEPRSRRPHSSPTRITDEIKQDALRVRAALESSGLDHGPISVHDKMAAMGMEPVPSVASLARIFRSAGVARLEPKKKPRAAWRRFVYPAPNACWQLDATEYVLQGGRKCCVFQLLDDHSRKAVATHVADGETADGETADGETAEGALAVVKKGIASHGVPQRFLSDNGVAINPSRRGYTGQLVAHLVSLGVEPITGKPGKPTTQGKNERFHQTLFRWLNKQPLAATIAELQTQVDRFDVIYNTERPHQGLPGRITPQQAWDATPTAEPPRPGPETTINVPELDTADAAADQTRTPAAQNSGGVRTTRVRHDGTIRVSKVEFRIGSRWAGRTVHVTKNDTTVKFFNHEGTLIAEHPLPKPTDRYIGTAALRPRQPENDEPSPQS